jgi:hypothetical protein
MEFAVGFIVRLAITVVATAGLTVGAVYFVVDKALSGIQQSIDVTNKRIDDIRNELKVANEHTREVIGLRIDKMQSDLRNEFENTRNVIRRGSLDRNEPIPIARPENRSIFARLQDFPAARQRVQLGKYHVVESILQRKSQGSTEIAIFPLIDDATINEKISKDFLEKIFLTARPNINVNDVNRLYPDCIRDVVVTGLAATFIPGLNGIKFGDTTLGCTVVRLDGNLITDALSRSAP